MTLNHLDLHVPDVAAAVALFTRGFGLTLTSSPRSPALAILVDDVGFTLVLQRADAPTYPDGVHVGFLVATPAEVHARHAHLAALEQSELGDVHQNGRGTLFYLRGPAGLLVEVSCRRA
ncbi:MAG: VOC family protein [Deltaproteobacteria bacterium]|nr:VOC family protein [Deltaproteobacteria bacterium]